MADKPRSNVIETECAYCGKYNAVDITDDVAELEAEIARLKAAIKSYEEQSRDKRSGCHDDEH